MKSCCPIPRVLRELGRRSREAFLSLLYPPHCAQCGADTGPGEHLCPRCTAEAPRVEAPFCQQCSLPYSGSFSAGFTCSNCADRQFHFQCAVAPYRQRGVVKELIHRFKYERHYYLRQQLAAWMAEGLQDERLRATALQTIVPVPLHAARRRHREFNQAEVLAQLLGTRTGLPVSTCLRRIRYTTTQTRLDRHQRMENLRGAFAVRHNLAVTDRHLLLVDDVLTTGSTVDECSRVLLAAGAASIRVLTVARA